MNVPIRGVMSDVYYPKQRLANIKCFDKEMAQKRESFLNILTRAMNDEKMQKKFL